MVSRVRVSKGRRTSRIRVRRVCRLIRVSRINKISRMSMVRNDQRSNRVRV